jgi:hypothetical protein
MNLDHAELGQLTDLPAFHASDLVEKVACPYTIAQRLHWVITSH